jgi:hypothetical protein
VIPPVLITSRGQSRFLDVPVGEGELGALQGYDRPPGQKAIAF